MKASYTQRGSEKPTHVEDGRERGIDSDAAG